MTSLRERLSDPRILVAVGAHDGLTATLAQRAGLEAVYQGGYAVAAHHHGLPDIGLVGLSDVAESLRRMTAVSSVPVIVDADTGYGSEPGVRRAVHELESAGAAAVQIEDQVFPKRCGHMEGKAVISTDDMVLKVRAAVDARRNPDTLIIARTDALQVHGLDDAIERCNAYAEAGADVTFVDAPRSREQLEEIARRVDGPSLCNMSETGRTPPLSADELQELGYSIVIFPSTQTWLFARVYQELLDEVIATGTSSGLRDRMMAFDDVNELLGLSRWEAMA
ncbi:MAG TPA: isocitrate lyase/phosphoenolpyruvate mutase family protein [Solirubrobacteraceae bacterium]|nr:isocitrate lyase/phosphoenolpyruvate mutase family protein [Solirubrobacteraceae bacterium]